MRQKAIKTFLCILSVLLCVRLGASDCNVQVPVKWHLEYGILLQDGKTRGELPEGNISEFIIKEDETKLELRNFFCSKAIRQLVCPVVFFDRNNRVVGYVEYKKQDAPFTYVVDIPKNCVKYKVSCEKVTSLNPLVYANRNEKNALARQERAMAEQRSALNSTFTTGDNLVRRQVNASRYLTSMPVSLNPTMTVDITGAEDLSKVISELESKYRNRTILIQIKGERYNVSKTQTLSASRNKYVIQSEPSITGLADIDKFTVKNGVLSFRRPESLKSIETVIINGNEYNLSGDYDQNDPDQMPMFKTGSIKLVSESSGRYVYRIPLKDCSHFSVGSYIKLYSEFVCQILPVTAVTKKYIEVTSQEKMSSTLLTYSYAENLYAVRNNRKYASKGDFWYDGNTVYCNLRSFDTDVKSVQVPVTATLFKITRASDIVFRNVHFEYTASTNIFKVYSQGGIDRDGCIAVERSSGIHFIGCEFNNIGDNCISFRNNTSSCSVQGSFMHNLCSGGIVMNNSKMPYQSSYVKDDTKNILIANNIIRTYGNVDAGSVGVIASYGDNISIISNHIFDGYYTAISVGWGWNQYHLNRNNYIAGNVVHHIMKFLLCDGGGIYTMSNWDGGLVECNTVYCVNTRSRRDCAFGIYHDQGSSNILDYKNVIYACDLGNGSCEANGLVENNIYSYIGDYVFQVRKDAESSMTNLVRNNIVYSCAGRLASTQETGIDNAKKTRLKDNAIVGSSASLSSTRSTFNAFDWKSASPSFSAPLKGDFTITNSSQVKKQMSFSTDRNVGFKGNTLTVSLNPEFAKYAALSSEYEAHYKELYRKMSLNKNNQYFQ